jgi:hypothetical protein
MRQLRLLCLFHLGATMVCKFIIPFVISVLVIGAVAALHVATPARLPPVDQGSR